MRGGALDPNRDVRARGIEIVTRWNVLEAQLANILNNRRTFPKEPKLNDVSVVGILVKRWAKLRPQDSDNVDFNTAVSALGLSAEHQRLLKSAGATDLRSIARALEAAQTVENYNAKIQTGEKRDRKTKSIAEPITFAISAAKAHEMRHAISDALAKSLEPKNKE